MGIVVSLRMRRAASLRKVPRKRAPSRSGRTRVDPFLRIEDCDGLAWLTLRQQLPHSVALNVARILSEENADLPRAVVSFESLQNAQSDRPRQLLVDLEHGAPVT